MDAWGVGCFIQEIFAGRKLTRTEELRDLSRIPQVRRDPALLGRAPTHYSRHIPQSLQKHYQRLLGSVPARRLNPAALLESTLFQNKLVRVLVSYVRQWHSLACARRWTPSPFLRS